MNLTPYQDKRKKEFPDGTTPEEAILQELLAFWKKEFPLVYEHLKENPNLLDGLVNNLAPVIAPKYAFDTTLPWTKLRIQNILEALLTLEEILSIKSETIIPRKRTSILLKPYQKHIKRLLTSEYIRDSLAKSMNSKKGAKKFLRVMHKRLGIYTKRKPPFHKILKIETN